MVARLVLLEDEGPRRDRRLHVHRVVVDVLRRVGGLAVPVLRELVLGDDPSRTGPAHLVHRRAEHLAELDRDGLSAGSGGDPGDAVGLAVGVVLRADHVVERSLADRLLAAHDRFGGVLVVLAGERRAVAPRDVVAQRVRERETVGGKLVLLGELADDLACVGVVSREAVVDEVPDPGGRGVGREHRLQRLDVRGESVDDPAARDRFVSDGNRRRGRRSTGNGNEQRDRERDDETPHRALQTAD